MKLFLSVVSLLGLIVGVLMLVYAKSAVHEIEGILALMTGFICMIGARLIEIGGDIHQLVKKQQNASLIKDDPRDTDIKV
jgi:hypothetical protein